jgi:hypothetical protein
MKGTGKQILIVMAGVAALSFLKMQFPKTRKFLG